MVQYCKYNYFIFILIYTILLYRKGLKVYQEYLLYTSVNTNNTDSSKENSHQTIMNNDNNNNDDEMDIQNIIQYGEKRKRKIIDYVVLNAQLFGEFGGNTAHLDD